MGLREEDLPALYQDANANSLDAQQRFLKFTRLGLVAVVIAAGAGAVSITVGSADVGGIVAAIAFISAVLLRAFLLKDRPEKIWYDGRAAAESAKTTAWRYAVGGEPFGRALTDKEANERFVQRLWEIPSELDPRCIVPSSQTPRDDITNGMKELRTSTLDERKKAYRDGRIRDQRNWYSGKAQWNIRRAKAWNTILISIEIVGAGAAILKAASLIDVGILGFAGALVAAGTSWLQTKQHTNLAEAYTVAARELSLIDTLLPSCIRDEDWTEFVGQAEEAISREHTLWIASRTSSSALNALNRNKSPRPPTNP